MTFTVYHMRQLADFNKRISLFFMLMFYIYFKDLIFKLKNQKHIFCRLFVLFFTIQRI